MASLLMTNLFLLCFLCSPLICLSSSIPTGFSILTDHEILPKFTTEEQVYVLFRLWQKQHRRVYPNPQEESKRFRIFHSNLKHINEVNAKRESPSQSRLGLNKFADLSPQEFRETYLHNVNMPADTVTKFKTIKVGSSCDHEVPDSLDWREKNAVTAVKNQGNCESHWAFSVVGAIEGINAIDTGKLISLSEQELMDCDTTNDGCEGGYMDYAFEWVISNGGIDTETDYPYTGRDGTCNITKEERKVVTIDGYTDVTQTESALLCATVKQPVSVGMDGSAYDFQLYTSGIYDGDCSSDPDDIDHAVLIVGYGSEDGEDYWIVKNSWGTAWGLDGYFLLKRNANEEYGKCAIAYMASYPTKESSAPSPTSPPPPVTPPPPPPSPPSPSPSECGEYSYCAADQTCCCIYELLNSCLIYGCCEYENAVCCSGTEYCCPSDYPICDIEEGFCLQKSGDVMGVPAKKKKMAKHKFPWSKIEGKAGERKADRTLEFKRNPFAAAMR